MVPFSHDDQARVDNGLLSWSSHYHLLRFLPSFGCRSGVVFWANSLLLLLSSFYMRKHYSWSLTALNSYRFANRNASIL
jgi:hypothetical protein